MLWSAKNGKRRWLIFGLVAAMSMFGAGIALAATETITAHDNTFAPGSPYSTDQGAVVPFQNSGFSQHNVTATATGPDGKPLFRSPTTNGGASSSVGGTQYLSAGDYPFFCTIHGPSMSGVLHVTSAGTAQARPNATLTLVSKKISKVAKKAKLLVGVNMTAPVDGASLVASLGKATLGRANSLSLKSGQQTVAIRLGKTAKNKLAKKSKATVTLSADIPFGSPASGKGKLR
jgi:plastocyanin